MIGTGALLERLQDRRIGTISALAGLLVAVMVAQVLFPLPTTFVVAGALIVMIAAAQPAVAAASYLLLLPSVLWLHRTLLVSPDESLFSLGLKGFANALLVLSALLYVARRGLGLVSGVIIAPVLAFYAFLLLTCARSDQPFFSVREWLLYLPGLAAYLLVSGSEDPRRTLRTIKLALWGSALVAGGIGVLQLLGWMTARSFRGLPRIDGGFEHPNQFAMFLLVVILGLLHFGQPLPGKDRRLAGWVVLVGALALLIFTFSRTSWIVLTGTLFLSGLLRRARTVSTLAVIGLVGLLAWDQVVPLVKERMVPDDAYYGRFKLVALGLMLWQEHPILGRGLGAFSLESQDYLGATTERYGIPVGISPHNDLVRFAVEGGLMGLTLYLLVMISVLSLGFRLWRLGSEWRPLGSYLLTLAAAVLTFGLADAGFFYGGPYLLTIAGAAEVALRRSTT